MPQEVNNIAITGGAAPFNGQAYIEGVVNYEQFFKLYLTLSEYDFDRAYSSLNIRIKSKFTREQFEIKIRHVINI